MGVLSVFIYPLLLTLPIFLKNIKSKIKKALILTAFFVPSIEVLYFGSRGIAITSLYMLFIYMWALGYISSLMSLKLSNLLVYAVLLVFMYISTSLFLERLTFYNLDVLYSAFNSVYAFTIIPNDFSVSIIEKYGMYTFSVVDKFLHLLFDMPALDNSSITPRYGIYTTLLGPLWVDFGYFSFLFLFLIGFFLSRSYYKYKSGNLSYLPLYAYLAAVVFFSPVVNLIQNALGMYVLIACINLIFLSKFILRFTVVRKK